MPKYDANGFEIAQDDNGFELVPDTTPPQEEGGFFSNFHPLEDLSSAGQGVLDFGKGLLGMGADLMTKGPMGMAVDYGNQLAGQSIQNAGLQAVNDPNAQSTLGLAAKSGIGALSPIPIDPFLDVLKGIGYGTHLTDTPVPPERAARGIGESAAAAAMFLGPMAHEPALPPLTRPERLLPASSEARTFYGGPGEGGVKEVKDFYNWQNPETGFDLNQVPSKVTRDVPLPDVPMTRTVGPKGTTKFEFNPENKTYTDRATGRVYDSTGNVLENPAQDFANQVIPDLEKVRDVISPSKLEPPPNLLDEPILEGGHRALPADNLPDVPIDLDQLQMALDEGRPLPEPKTKQLNPEKEVKVVRQLIQETGATADEAIKMRQLQRIYPQESTRRLREFVQENPGLFDKSEPTIEGPQYSRVEPQVEIEGPQYARVQGGKAQISVNVKRAADELTTGYSGPLEGIMVREGLQNAFDAVRKLGDKGHVKVKLEDDGIEITDNGKGMTPEDLYTVYTNLHESGKINEADATGGKGVGKAPYMLGGEHFEVRTVTEVGGKKIESSFKGSPEELMQPFDIDSREVPYNTPTGTWFRTKFKAGQHGINARSMFTRIMENTRDLGNTVQRDLGNNVFDTPRTFKSFKVDKLIGSDYIGFDQSTGKPANKVDLYVPHNATNRDSSYIEVVYLNNGMYQFKDTLWLGEEAKQIPDQVIVNLKPQVPEGSSEYPFPVQRESVKEGFSKEIEELIKDKIVKPTQNRVKQDLQKLWNGMKAIGIGAREKMFYDPGDRLTKNEVNIFKASPTVRMLSADIDQMLNEILNSTEKPNWVDKVSRVGITLDDKLYGIHIPNPFDLTKSAILLNPFEQIRRKPPSEAALDMVVTALHEVAHVGNEKAVFHPLDPTDLADPRVGRFLQTYIQETMTQGGLDLGHGFNFIHRLGEIYGRYGTEAALTAADRIQKSISDPLTGGYSREVQELLRIYTERAGRKDITTDLLTGTGIKQAVNRRGARGFSSFDRADGERVSKGREVVNRKRSNVIEAFNLPRALQASMDLSAPLRQGRAFVLKKQYWSAFNDMFKALGSEEAFRNIEHTIQTHPLFRFAQNNGLSFTDLTDLSKREEAIMSSWAETGGNLGKFSDAYAGTIGRGVRATNRAYTAFLNKLRMDVFADLVEKNNLQRDIPQARIMADFVNTATGRGSLGRFEKVATELNTAFFAPRNTVSQIKMLNIFNPNHYIYQPGPVRMEALKSLAGIFGTTMLVGGLLKMGGAKISMDPTSSDFMKAKIGKTRLDFNGGYGQYLVSFARLANSLAGDGKFTSSRNNRTYKTDAISEMGRVLRNKEHPVVSFAHSFATGKTPTGQRFQVAPQTMQLFTPMLAGDLATLAKTQPGLLPFVAPLATFGAGVQTY